MSDSDRHYTDRDMALILCLAAEMEVGATAASGEVRGSPGHTLAQIQEIAAGAGISRAAVAAAAAALDSEPRGLMASLVGAPTVFRFERSVPAEIDPGEVSELLADLMDRVEGQVHRIADATRRPELAPSENAVRGQG